LDGLQNDLAGPDSDDLDDQERFLPSLPSEVYDSGLWERHALLFRHSQSSATLDLRGYHPTLSQRPDLLDTFKKNINCMIQFVHMPAVSAMLSRAHDSEMPPANEVLMFSIYYATLISLDENEVRGNTL
jgi:hypothetical protein